MSRLIVREGPTRGAVYELVEDAVSIGRDPTNAIQIPSETVSRSHAVMTRKRTETGETWEIRDLKSKNGVVVNHQRVASIALASGDEIRLGDSALSFIAQEFDPIESREMSEHGEGLVLRDTIIAEHLAIQAAPAGADEAQRRLRAILELSRTAATAASLSELFGAVAVAVESNLHPHRVVPILFDERKGMLRPYAPPKGEFDTHLSGIPISSTIINHVRDRHEAILSEATRKDDRLRGARSIVAHQITSAVCAPIEIGGRIFGAIYADRLGDAERFTKEDLELLTAFAMQAAVAVENVRIREEMGRELTRREREARGEYDTIGQCDAIRQVFRFIAKAAPTDSSVLIEGESGTGKELVARAIHVNSTRRHKPFETVNCAAIAPTLIESELFGHVRGAFTGADRDREGRFELADAGTLFLDEIGELPESCQSKLLRVIETGVLRRVGDTKDRKVNVRVIAATNKNLSKEVAARRFREDLYFRLNVLHVRVPPLRERQGDIRLLADHFLRQIAAKCGRPRMAFDESALALLEQAPWPGNVRELRNIIERMVVMAEGEVLKQTDVPLDLLAGVPTSGAFSPSGPGPFSWVPGARVPLRDVEAAYVAHILAGAGGNKKEAARILGIDRSTLYAKIRAHNLDEKDDE